MSEVPTACSHFWYMWEEQDMWIILLSAQIIFCSWNVNLMQGWAHRGLFSTSTIVIEDKHSWPWLRICCCRTHRWFRER